MDNTIINKASSQYQYKIDPSGAASSKTVESNVVNTNLVIGTLSVVGSVDKTYATIGDTLNYTVKLTNNGNILLSSIKFTDTLPVGAKFVAGSVKVDGTVQPTYDIAAGFDLGSMIILGTKTVTFQAEVESLPTPNTIINKAKTTFSYVVGTSINGSAESNAVTTTVNVSNLSVVKSANVTDVESGDNITYTVVVSNTGNVTATNVVFTDTLDSHLTFVAGSVTINGTTEASYYPGDGFSLPDIAPSGSVTVTFEASVN